MADKELSFAISIDGISAEATELVKIELQLKAIKKERDELIKQASKPGHIASTEERLKLAAYNKEIGAQEAALKTLKRVVDTASDSLARKKALLIELTSKSDKATQAVRDGMAPAILKLNNEIKAGENARGVFNRNVGNYPQLFESMPGPVGRFASSLNAVTTKLKEFGPVGALIGGGLIAISAPLVAFFTKSEKGVELLERKVGGFKAGLSVFTGEIINMGDKMTEAFDKPEKKGGKFWTFLSMLLGPAWLDVGMSADIAAASMEKYIGGMQQLEDMERGMIVPRAEANLQIKQARSLYNDETKSHKERIAALQDALNLETRVTTDEISNQNKKILLLSLANDEKKRAGQLRDEDDNVLQEAIARGIELETESVGRKIKVEKILADAKKEFYLEELNQVTKMTELKEHNIEAEAKMKKFFFDKWKKMVEDEKNETNFLVEYKKLMGIKEKDLGLQENKEITERNIKGAKAASEDDVRIAKETEDKKLAIKQAALQGAQQGADAAFNSKRSKLQAEMEAELSNQNLTETQKVAIRKKYGKEQQRMDITQAVINTALAVGSALTTKPFLPMGLIAAGLAGVTGAIQIATIKAAKYARGGKVNSGVTINTGQKDDTLIMVNKTETVLTDRHVAMLGGSGVMKRIGVPGYASGGYVGQQAPIVPAAGLDIEALANMINSIDVRLDTHKVRSSLQETEVTLSHQRI